MPKIYFFFGYFMKKIVALLAILLTVSCFETTDLDGDGIDDSFTIFINGENHQAHKCVEEVLHASNELTDAGWIEMCNN